MCMNWAWNMPFHIQIGGNHFFVYLSGSRLFSICWYWLAHEININEKCEPCWGLKNWIQTVGWARWDWWEDKFLPNRVATCRAKDPRKRVEAWLKDNQKDFPSFRGKASLRSWQVSSVTDNTVSNHCCGIN